MHSVGQQKPNWLGRFYGLNVPDPKVTDIRSKSTPPILPPIHTNRSTSKQDKLNRKQDADTSQLPDHIDANYGNFGRKVGFGPARKKAFPRPLSLYSKNIKIKNLAHKTPETTEKEKASLSTTLRKLPNIYETGMVNSYVFNNYSKDYKVRQRDEQETKEFNLKELDLAYKIRERIQQFKKWQKDQEKKAKHVAGKYINSNEFSQRERNMNILKLSSIFRNEQEDHEKQHVSRTLNLGELIKKEQAPIDEIIARKCRENDEAKNEENFYPFSPSGSWRTGSSPARMPNSFMLERERTMKTWKTWRDPNESYAYCDVNKYIEEHELLPEDKEKRISQWIDDVFDATVTT